MAGRVPYGATGRALTLGLGLRLPLWVETRYAQRGTSVEITGLNDPSADLHGRLTGELAGSH